MKKLLLAALCLLCLPTPARANLDFYFFDATGPNARYSSNDLLDIQESRGVLPVPNTSPYRIVRVETTQTKAQVVSYVARGTTGARRRWYLDPAKMSTADRANWDTNRAIQVSQATVISWLTRKSGQ